MTGVSPLPPEADQQARIADLEAEVSAWRKRYELQSDLIHEWRCRLGHLRAAVERLTAHLGDPEDWVAPCGCFEDVSGIRDAMENVRAALEPQP
jgi:hypothetical protein